jgi:hypothetical protein
MPKGVGWFFIRIVQRKTASLAIVTFLPWHHNIWFGTGNNRDKFIPFWFGYLKLIKSEIEIFHECYPLLACNLEMSVRLVHRPPLGGALARSTAILLRAASCPTRHFRDQIFESGGRDAVMGFINEGIGI